jgi:flagellin
VNVINTQVQNLTSAEDGIRSADIATVVGNLSKYQIMNQTGISALAQANSSQQSVLKLVQ